MKEYRIEFDYIEPRWGDVLLFADTEEEAKELAIQHVMLSYPEADDIEITLVEEVVDDKKN